MKKFLFFGMTVIMLFSLVGCDEKDKSHVAGDKADSTSTFEVGEPNWND